MRGGQRLLHLDEGRRLGLLRERNRRLIYAKIRSRPGIHMRQLERELRIPFGTLRYHLRLLRKGGLVVTRKIDRFKSYFVVGELGRRDKDYLYHLRQELPRQIALEVAYSRWLSRASLVGRLARSPSTVSFHLKKLLQNGIIHETSKGRRKYYRLANPSRLHRLLARYEHTFSLPSRIHSSSDVVASEGAPDTASGRLRPKPLVAGKL